MMELIVLRNLIAVCAQLAILTAVCGALPWLLRVRTPGIVYSYFRILLVLALCLPFVQPWRASVISEAASVRGAAVTVGAIAVRENLTDATPTGGFVPSARTAALLLMMMLGAGALIRLVWLAAGFVRLRRLRRQGRVAALPPEFDDLPRIVGARAEMRWLDTLSQPVTFGLRCPVVLLPASLGALDIPQQRTVIAHELIHVQRRDWMWVVAEELLRAVFWFHPAVWWLISRIQLAREQVVDELTVAATSSRRAYMEALLAFADRTPLAPVTAFVRRRHLFKRMALISKEAVMSSKRLAVSCAAMAAVVLLTGWFAASSFPLEASAATAASAAQTSKPGPPPPPPPAPQATTTPEGRELKVVHRVQPVYPAEARAANARAFVTLAVTIDAAGNVTQARVRGVSVGNVKDVDQVTMREITDALIRAATDAALQSRYEPTGKATVATAMVSVRPPEDAQRFVSTIKTTSRATSSLPANAVRVGGDITPPTKTYQVDPVYPPIARAAQVQGVVIVEAVVDEAGGVSDARILRSIPLLDQAALDAVKQWRFTPTVRDGKPVPVVMTVTINFSLGDDAPPPPPPPPPAL
jgi:TonB family protein